MNQTNTNLVTGANSCTSMEPKNKMKRKNHLKLVAMAVVLAFTLVIIPQDTYAQLSKKQEKQLNKELNKEEKKKNKVNKTEKRKQGREAHTLEIDFLEPIENDQNEEFDGEGALRLLPAGYARPVKVTCLVLNSGRQFGSCRHDNCNSCCNRIHAGIDFVPNSNGNGVPVYAVTSGTVRKDPYIFFSCTYALEVLNDDGSIILYGEITSDLRAGMRVEKGDQIGKIKQNCNGGSSMLHLEYFNGDGAGGLQNKSNCSNYTYIIPKCYKRRSDLLDPTDFYNLPNSSTTPTKPVISWTSTSESYYAFGDGLTVSWQPVSGATSYHLIIKQLAGVPNPGDNEPGYPLKNSSTQDWVYNWGVSGTSVVLTPSTYNELLRLTVGKYVKIYVQANLQGGTVTSDYTYILVRPKQPTLLTNLTSVTAGQTLSLSWIGTGEPEVRYNCYLKELTGGIPDEGDDTSNEPGDWEDKTTAHNTSSTSASFSLPSNLQAGRYLKIWISANANYAGNSWEIRIPINAVTGTCVTIPNYDYSITPTTNWNTSSSNILTQGCKMYRFYATQGERYTFKTGCGDGATANFDTQLYLYNNSGTQVAYNDDGCESNRDKIEDWQCGTSGYYYLKVKGYSSYYGNYTLAYRRISTSTGCTNGTQYPSSTFTPTCTGSNESIAANCYAGEYSVVQVTNGTSYTFSSSIGTDYITITNSAGTTILTTGTGSVNWTAASSTTIRFYTHTNSSCGTSSANRSRMVRCGNPGMSVDAIASNLTTIGSLFQSFTLTLTNLFNRNSTPLAGRVGFALYNNTGSIEIGYSPARINFDDLLPSWGWTSFPVGVNLSDFGLSSMPSRGTYRIYPVFSANLSSPYRPYTFIKGTDNSDKYVTITILSDNANLSSLSVSQGTLSPSFNSNTTNYTVAVPYSVTSITISATKADSYASFPSISIGTKTLNVGNNVFDIVVTAEAGNTKTYTIVVSRALETCGNNTDNGVIINGVKWATRNVCTPGLFATNPESAGWFYQWNRKVGWSATDPLINSNGGTTWDNSQPTGTIWTEANDPCPTGWRVPTLSEIQGLLGIGQWTTVNGIGGRRFTDPNNNNNIFLPAVGTRYSNGVFQEAGNGYYRTSNFGADHATYLWFDNGATAWNQTHDSRDGMCVRCVAKTFTITASVGSGGSISPNGTQTVYYGDNKTFTATPNNCQEINQWTVNGSIVQTGGNTYTISNVQANATIQVTFKTKTFTVTPSAGTGGSILPNTAQIVNCGSNITFTATPNSCQEVNQWTVNGSVVQIGGNSYTTSNIQTNATIQVTFKTKTFTVTPSAGTGGSISPNTLQTVNCGSSITFTATPNNCQEVNQWIVNGSDIQTGGNSYTMSNIQANATIQVTFKTKTFTVTPSADTGGSISPSIVQTVNCGSNITFTVTPSNCQEVDQWRVNGSVVQAGGNTYTVLNVQENITILVTFKTIVLTWQIGYPNAANVTATFNCNNGTLTISGSGVGEMQDWNSPHDRPWHSIKDLVTNIVINSGVKTIGDHAFYDFYNLISAVIPHGVTRIGESSFNSCCKVASVNIPSSVTYIGSHFFAWPFCGDGLTDVTVNWEEPLTIPSNTLIFAGHHLPNVNLHVPSGTECLYAATPVWQNFNIIGAQRAITPSADTGGSITPNTMQTVNCGANITFTAIPNNCQEVDQWKVNGIVAQTGGSLYIVSNVQENATIQVTFKTKTFTITPSADTGGSISPNTMQTVNCGSNVTFTATPDNCQEIDQWKVNGIVVQTGGNSYSISNVQESTTVQVTFKTKTFIVTPSADTGGSILPNTMQTVNCGSYITFTATPDNCQEIDQWKVNGIVAQTGENLYTVSNVQENATIQVTFKTKTFTVTPSADTGGSISPNTMQTVNCGSNVTFTATPDNCQEIDQWKVNGIVVQSGGNLCTVSNVQENTTVHVTFKTKTFTVTPSADTGGSISPNTTQTVDCGDDITFTAMPYDNQEVVHWKMNENIVQAGGNNYTISNIQDNATISVTFKPVVGIDENIAQKIQIYPNPTNSEIHIKSESPIHRVEIYSIMGALLLSENNFKEKISVSALATGVYLVKIYVDNDTVIHKIVRE